MVHSTEFASEESEKPCLVLKGYLTSLQIKSSISRILSVHQSFVFYKKFQ
ncbi:Uncharacterized protein ChrSV_4742 [Chromobacterium vaccinii]|nr:Uncharacterized protein ChrSW_4742 [Chromobacterium vaccinii]QND92197.1 Uncharacterized protein ChrSV_4742 [Chromobacterium vaccinii]